MEKREVGHSGRRETHVVREGGRESGREMEVESKMEWDFVY